MNNQEVAKDVILLVDDQPINLKVLASVLSEDYSLSIANNGMNALKMLEKGLPDLILLDIMMPEIDGYEVCKRIKENEKTKDIPIIFLTAKTDIQDIIKGFDYGAADYMTKPFNPTEVKVRVVNQLNLHHAKNEIKQMYQKLLLSQEALKNANQQLEQSNREKDKFFSILSHDLRSPLGGFVSLTEMMADNSEDLSMHLKKKMMKDLSHSSRNIFNLLNNLLEWSSMQNGLTIFNPQVLELNKIVNDSVKVMIETARNKSINIAVEIPETQEVFADTMMLQIIIRNFISNAVKFTPRGGKITISACPGENKSVIITVKDTGIGMSPVLLGNLFRIDAKTRRPGTERESSSGLGLILCKEFIEKHGGKVWVESEEEKGSAFSLSLPGSSK